MQKRIIAICGGMGAGKDTLADLLIEEFTWKKTSFSEELKNEVQTFIDTVCSGRKCNPEEFTLTHEEFNFAKPLALTLTSSRERTPESRRLLQFWGTDLRRKQDINYWVNQAEKKLKDKIVFTDARFENEIEMLRNNGAITILLDVPIDERIKRIEERDGITPSDVALSHPSEQIFLQKPQPNEFDIILQPQGLSVGVTYALLKEGLRGFMQLD